jgi:hypothetical protein
MRRDLEVLAADGVELRRALQEEHHKRKARAGLAAHLRHCLAFWLASLCCCSYFHTLLMPTSFSVLKFWQAPPIEALKRVLLPMVPPSIAAASPNLIPPLCKYHTIRCLCCAQSLCQQHCWCYLCPCRRPMPW